jgi:phosphoribosylformylglycinamidine cyclo-ligase
LPGNVPRVLPPGVSVELEWGAWPVPPIFGFLQDAGAVPFDEMARVFNMGLGMLLIAAPEVELPAIEVGRVVSRASERVILRR